MQKIYPFKFLDSYQPEDKDFFFGRDQEIEELYHMIFQTRIMVVFGTSGTGKTSLIQCGLANKFKAYDWLALYVRRGTNLLSSLDKAICQASNGLYQLSGNKRNEITELEGKLRAVYKSSFRPIYLIFDQFEELYVIGSKAEQKNFVKSIRTILDLDLPVKIILSIREEYLGYLYEFEKEVPQLMRKKLRVEPMKRDKVGEVIRGINDLESSLVSFKKDELEKITDEIFKRLQGKEKTLTIPLPFLQVFLDKLYLTNTNDPGHQTETTISLKDLNEIGTIEDVLKDFLEEQVKEIGKNLHSTNSNITTDTIWSILSNFCTLEGTKEPISKDILLSRMKSVLDKELINTCVEEFESRRIVKNSDEEDLYELVHDSLALRISERRNEHDVALIKAKSFIKSNAAFMDDSSEYFSEKHINSIEPVYKRIESELSPKEKNLYNASKQKIEDDRIKREKEEERKRLAAARKLRNKKIRNRLVLIAAIVIVAFLGYKGNKSLEQNKIAQDMNILKEKIGTTDRILINSSLVADKNPTFALQLNYLALQKLDSLKSKDIKDSILNKKYGIFSQFSLMSNYIENEFDVFYEDIKIKEDQIYQVADSILAKDFALYKITKVSNSEDFVQLPHVSNAIFPKENTFNVWHGGNNLESYLKNDSTIKQTIFPRSSFEAMVLYKNGKAKYFGNNPAYKRIKLGEYDRINSIAPVHYKEIGYKMLSVINNSRIVEWNLNGTIRKSKNRAGDKKSVIYEFDKTSLFGDTVNVTSVAMSKNRGNIFTAWGNGIGIIWETDTVNVELESDTRKVFNLYQQTVKCSAFSDDGSMIITGAVDNTVKIWDVQTGNLIKELKGHFGPVTSVAFSKNNGSVYTGSMDRTIRTWVLPSDSLKHLKQNVSWNKEVTFNDLFEKGLIDISDDVVENGGIIQSKM